MKKVKTQFVLAASIICNLSAPPAHSASPENEFKTSGFGYFDLQITKIDHSGAAQISDDALGLVDCQKFLGTPLVALLPYPTGKPIQVLYYAMVLPYNIPVPESSKVKYDFARFSASLALASDTDKKLAPNVNVISVAPVNDFLTINHSSSNQFTATLDPQYAGISVGSLQEQITKADEYQYDLPKTLSTVSIDNDCSWSYYPQKNRPFAAGQKSAIIMFAVKLKSPITISDSDKDQQTAEDSTSLRNKVKEQLVLKSSLSFKISGHSGRYQLKHGDVYLNLGEAVTLKDVLAMHSFDVPQSLLTNFVSALRSQSQLLTINTASAAKSNAAGGNTKDDKPVPAYVQDSVTGNVYFLDGVGGMKLVKPSGNPSLPPAIY